MRREIARQMHDGPAQSLTNIVLQAQIVERLVGKDPARASQEVHQLVAMVQQTLDATKTFIFDVRPMVLDDLGLVPTLRRVGPGSWPAGGRRDRIRVAGPGPAPADGPRERAVPDPRRGPGRLPRGQGRTRLAQGRLGGRPAERRDGGDAGRRTAAPEVVPDAKAAKDLPPALAAMMEERRADARIGRRDARSAIRSSPCRPRRGARSRAARPRSV